MGVYIDNHLYFPHFQVFFNEKTANQVIYLFLLGYFKALIISLQFFIESKQGVLIVSTINLHIVQSTATINLHIVQNKEAVKSKCSRIQGQKMSIWAFYCFAFHSRSTNSDQTWTHLGTPEVLYRGTLTPKGHMGATQIISSPCCGW